VIVNQSIVTGGMLLEEMLAACVIVSIFFSLTLTANSF